MPSGSGPTSPTQSICGDRKHSIDSLDHNKNAPGLLTRTISYDPTEYVQKARVTKAAPPKPAYNPMQFVQLKPCNLFKSAQEQLKKAEEVKKVKEVKKEEPEEWQCNLDNWKSSRRKRVEHIIDRVVEVKKLELEEHDRNRRKSKTFSEMMEERGSRRKLSLAIYTEDDANDLSDLGIGTSSASGKSSLSEDFDNQSVISDTQDTEKSLDLDLLGDNNKTSENDENDHGDDVEENNNRDYVSSPGYDTSSSTAPASSPDPSEYTYEGAIQDYKTRVSRAGQIYNNGNFSKDSTPERQTETNYYISSMKKHSLPSCKFDDRYMEIIKNGNNTDKETAINEIKKDLPKVDILKRRELFEKEQTPPSVENLAVNRVSNDFTNSKSIKERLSSLEQTKPVDLVENNITKRSSPDVQTTLSIKNRLSNLEKEKDTSIEKINKIEVSVSAVTLKDRLSSLQTAVASTVPPKEDEPKQIIVLVNKSEKEEVEIVNQTTDTNLLQAISNNKTAGLVENDIDSNDTDREDSGIHTTDVSCSVSQADEQHEEQQIEEELVSFDDNVKNDLAETFVVQSIIENEPLVPEMIAPIRDDMCSPELDEINEQDISVSQSLSDTPKVEGIIKIDLKQLNSINSSNNDSAASSLDLVRENGNDDVVIESIVEVVKPSITKNENSKAKIVTLRKKSVVKKVKDKDERRNTVYEVCEKKDIEVADKRTITTPVINVDIVKPNKPKSPTCIAKKNSALLEFIHGNLLADGNTNLDNSDLDVSK